MTLDSSTAAGTPPETCDSDSAATAATQTLSPAAEALVRWFDQHRTVFVAFSGGVDSSVVLAAALRSSAQRCKAATTTAPGNSISVTAVTARSPSVAQWQLQTAATVAQELGATQQVIDTDELALPAYAANDSRRCFHCKTTLYRSLHQLVDAVTAQTRQTAEPQTDAITIVSGTNADDLGDYRPGIAAGDEAGVQTPLADLGIGKAAVRDIARQFGLSNAELPAAPCLASRIAYGVQVTPERLTRIEQAEDYLRSLGLSELRVRLHPGELARIEIPLDQIDRLLCDQTRKQLSGRLIQLGFQYVTLDLQGLSSGSMNRPLVSLQLPDPITANPPQHDSTKPGKAT
ncbi:ATP-dependent sacrificial sulfur transferase LarE [Stieleria sp. TO1_6]|uniref:ATP-dependent sacrificial sulfur transferase LarE n=1 Tax=Stieleria tagensis TaxID=2956795 RepID=UPI00209B034D|nr:ATP-dependent sacrificial sulfur transferase LarE [Stieleria tagensis]MCO8120842.1 ATP-dependent sacrificial sulfur transferase LarE [Stieleria tagensis]